MCCPQYASKFGKLSSGNSTRKGPFPIPKKDSAKECWNYCTIAVISHASKVMLKTSKPGLENFELPDAQAGFRKGRGNRDQLGNIRCIMEKAIEFQKNIYFCCLTTLKPSTVWIRTNFGKFLKRWEYQTTGPGFWDTFMQIKEQQNYKWNNGQVPNWERSTSRLYIVTLLI